MNSRERVRATLNHQKPDRVPVDLGGWQSGISYETYIQIKRKLNFNAPNIIEEPTQGLAKVDKEILELFEVDTRYVFMKPPKDWNGTVKEDGYFEDKFGIKWCHSFYDEWGVKLHRQKNSHYYEMVYRKLSTISYEELDTYSWPDPNAPSRNFGLKEEVKSLFEDTNYSIFSCGPGLFEQSWGIYGLEEYMIKIIDDIKYIEKLLDKVLITLQGLYTNFLDIRQFVFRCIAAME